MLTELRAIRMLLERTFKPPTVQYLWIFAGRFNSLPIGPGAIPGALLLDLDDDRVGVLIFNNGAGAGFIRPDDGNIPTINDAFPIQPGASFTLGQNGVCGSNRLFAVQAAGGADFFVWVHRVDRFPRSTR